jgi:hypothetical protein
MAAAGCRRLSNPLLCVVAHMAVQTRGAGYTQLQCAESLLLGLGLDQNRLWAVGLRPTGPMRIWRGPDLAFRVLAAALNYLISRPVPTTPRARS